MANNTKAQAVVRPKAWLAWSSGKDSAWALHTVRRNAVEPGGAEFAFDVVALLTTVNRTYERVAMHAVRESLLEMQAVAADLPLVKVPIPSPCPNEIYERTMSEAMERARAEGIRHVIFGDLFLEDVRAYRERQLAQCGLTPVFPLWGRDTRELAEDMLAGGLSAYLTCVDPRHLDRAFAGRRFDRSFSRLCLAQLIPAVKTGSSTRSRSRGRCSARRFPSPRAKSWTETALFLPISCCGLRPLQQPKNPTVFSRQAGIDLLVAPRSRSLLL